MNNSISVSRLTAYIKDVLSRDPMLKRVSVKGEVSNCKYHSSGHIYFTLKDEEAMIRAVMFAGKRNTGLAFRMQDGDKVVVSGAIDVYGKAGDYQLYADKIELDGEGDLYLKFLKLKEELEEMGMFDESYKQPIPSFARTIGIVTASTGAAVRDIITVSKRRNPYVKLVLFPAQVQGEGAAQSVVTGIKTLEKYVKPDVIIIGRGGGSIEDLWAFNEEIVARAIFDCSIPIISAVGHETDTTIADYVADKRAATPSQAAEFASCDLQNILGRIAYYEERINNLMAGELKDKRNELMRYKLNLQRLSPENQLNEKKHRSMLLEERLTRAMLDALEERKKRLSIDSAKLDALSPLKKLSQGYSYVSDDAGHTVNSVEKIKAGDKLHVYVYDGDITAQVLDIESVSREVE